MKINWFSRRTTPNYGITYGDSNMDIDYTDDNQHQNLQQSVDYFRVGFKHHPRWNEVYTAELQYAKERFYNQNGYPVENDYRWVKVGVEMEAHSNAEKVIMLMIQNGY